MPAYTHKYKYIRPFYSVKIPWSKMKGEKAEYQEDNDQKDKKIESIFYWDTLIAIVNQ